MLLLVEFLGPQKCFSIHTVDHDIFTECVFEVTAEGIENNWFERYTLNIEIKSVLLMGVYQKIIH